MSSELVATSALVPSSACLSRTSLPFTPPAALISVTAIVDRRDERLDDRRQVTRLRQERAEHELPVDVAPIVVLGGGRGRAASVSATFFLSLPHAGRDQCQRCDERDRQDRLGPCHVRFPPRSEIFGGQPYPRAGRKACAMNDDDDADLETLEPVDLVDVVDLVGVEPRQPSRPSAPSGPRRRWPLIVAAAALVGWITVALVISLTTDRNRPARDTRSKSSVTTSPTVPSFGPDPFGVATGRFAAVVDGRVWIVDAGTARSSRRRWSRPRPDRCGQRGVVAGAFPRADRRGNALRRRHSKRCGSPRGRWHVDSRGSAADGRSPAPAS